MFAEFKKGFGSMLGMVCGAYCGALIITAAGVYFKKSIEKEKETDEQSEE